MPTKYVVQEGGIGAGLAVFVTACVGTSASAPPFAIARAKPRSEYHLEIAQMAGGPGNTTAIAVDGDRATFTGQVGDAAGIFATDVSEEDRVVAERVLSSTVFDQPLLPVDSAATRYVLDTKDHHLNLLFAAGREPSELRTLFGRLLSDPKPLCAFRIRLRHVPRSVDAGDSITGKIVIENVGTEPMELSLQGDFFVNAGHEPKADEAVDEAWRLGDLKAPSVVKADHDDREPEVLQLEPGQGKELQVVLKFPERGHVKATAYWNGDVHIAGAGDAASIHARLKSNSVQVDVAR